ncbi:hypothetical protein ATANTOWER_007841 [Ataeniobius toweri]|uniref:Uncharacterized protein n=1 Tax=Ataeniobius toweri TaxID=208326 RepID=A0ABU7A500_9TELE|nr:hypothetical protein [Ataeniobius toweri]
MVSVSYVAGSNMFTLKRMQTVYMYIYILHLCGMLALMLTPASCIPPVRDPLFTSLQKFSTKSKQERGMLAASSEVLWVLTEQENLLDKPCWDYAAPLMCLL